MLLPFLILGTALSVAHAAPAKSETIDLGYAKYQGTTENGVDKFLGMRFADPPTGNNRFRAPQKPTSKTKDTIQATKLAAHCISTPEFPIGSQSNEDCLFTNVYAPKEKKKLHPVFVYIQGGGLNGAGNPDDGTGLVNAGEKDIVVVTFNYRVGVLGFLASKEVKLNGDLNAGNLDQRFLLKWIQEHISKFGGDPKRVTLGGGSAGAMSVNLQMTAYGGRDDGLFSAVAGESNSFGSAKTVEESQYQYDALVDRAGCKGNKNTLECLRNLKIEDLAKANVAIPNQGRETKPLFMYSTVIDGDFMRGNMYGMLEKGNFVKVPSIFGGTTNEGTVFTPTPMNNYNDVNKFLKDQFPKYIDAQLAEIDHWYPKAENFGTKGEYWRTAANAWGEIRYNCPGVYLNNVMLAAGHKDTWHYHYAVASDADAKSGNGATHVRDSMVLWGTASGPDKEQVPTLQAYWASFIRNHDPNKQKAKDAPTWDSWTDPKGEQKRLRFDTDVKKNRMENLDTVQKERCEAMRKIGKVVGQ